MPKPVRAALLAFVFLAIATATGLAIKDAIAERAKAQPVVPKTTVLLFTSEDGPFDPSKQEATGVVHSLLVADPGVARQFRDILPGESFKVRYDGDRIIGIQRIADTSLPPPPVASQAD